MKSASLPRPTLDLPLKLSTPFSHCLMLSDRTCFDVTYQYMISLIMNAWFPSAWTSKLWTARSCNCINKLSFSRVSKQLSSLINRKQSHYSHSTPLLKQDILKSATKKHDLVQDMVFMCRPRIQALVASNR